MDDDLCSERRALWKARALGLGFRGFCLGPDMGALKNNTWVVVNIRVPLL